MVPNILMDEIFSFEHAHQEGRTIEAVTVLNNKPKDNFIFTTNLLKIIKIVKSAVHSKIHFIVLYNVQRLTIR